MSDSPVRITYTPAEGYARELPFTIGVIANLSGNPAVRLPKLRERQFVEIGRGNFNSFLSDVNPRVAFEIDGSAVELTFRRIEDFEPQRIARQSEKALAAPELRRLANTWRGLHSLASKTAVRVLDATPKDLRMDLARASRFDQSGIFKLVHDDVFGVARPSPISLLVSDIEFGPDPGDMDLLEKIAPVAAAIHAPFLAAASRSMFGVNDFAELERIRTPDVLFQNPMYAKWRSIRRSEDAKYVVLTIPQAARPAPEPRGPASWFGFGRGRPEPEPWKGVWSFAVLLAEHFGTWRWWAGESEDEIGSYAQLGFLRWSPPDPVEFRDAVTIFAPDSPADRCSASLPVVMAVSRWAQYLKTIVGDYPRPFDSVEACENVLKAWIQRYVGGATPTAERPLSNAHIRIEHQHVYRAILRATPGYNMPEQPVAARAIVALPPDKIAPDPLEKVRKYERAIENMQRRGIVTALEEDETPVAVISPRKKDEESIREFGQALRAWIAGCGQVSRIVGLDRMLKGELPQCSGSLLDAGPILWTESGCEVFDVALVVGKRAVPAESMTRELTDLAAQHGGVVTLARDFGAYW